jgi:sugar lactone lactonase YvrE
MASRERRKDLSFTACCFLLALALVAAVPVLAAEPPAGSEGAEGETVNPPSAQQVAEGLEVVEREEAARQRELEEPEAVQQREASATAYEDLTASESRQLLLSAFPDVLTQLNADPARALDDLHLTKVFGETVATVRTPEGEGSLLEADIPIRTENDEGELEKVKLTLVRREEGFEPENPLTDVLIPPTAEEQFAVGEEGLSLGIPGAEAPGEPLGDMQVYYPEAQQDTDLLAAPIAGGLELFDQLRSPESPEALHFHLDLPKGATVAANSSGGAEVTKEGEAIAIVPPPTAVDAQGTNVPLQLEVQGADLTLHVSHRGGNYAYPILVDPAINENYNSAWYSGNSFDSLNIPGIWDYATNDPTETYILHDTYCLTSALCSPTARGLFVSTLNRNIPANTYGQWYYSVPGSTTYIPSIYPEPSAIINPFWRNNGNCSVSSYSQPHDYDGAYDASGNWVYLETERAQSYGSAEIFTKAKGVAIGLSTAGSSVNIPCWRNIMVGGVAVRLDDPENPTLSSVTGFPTGWIGANTKFTITANISDPGLGVRNVKVYPSGMPSVPYVSEASECPGTKVKPCPSSRAAQISLKAENFDEGEKKVEVSGWDPTSKVSNTVTTMMKVDRQAPQITVGGQLGQATHETQGDEKDPTKWDELSLPVYNLQVEAFDGGTAGAEQKRSGVKSIELFVDEKTTPEKTWTQECPASSCSMTQSYQFPLASLSPGKHVLKVVAKDQVGQARTREIGFEFVPATGIKDDYVMQHFPLPDGKEHSDEETYGGPELAVNIANGNLVFREEDVDLEGPNVDLELERVYNSLLPNEDNTEWGDGWTLAQTPELEPVDTGGSSAPDLAKIVDDSGGLKDQVDLPEGSGASEFDPNLQATVKKTASGFELSDATGESAQTIEFSSAGRAEGVDAPGEASIDYDYESGAISDMAVEDPTSSMEPPPSPESLKPVLPVPTYQSATGTKGTADGQLRSPADVAIGSEGNVWAVDRENNRVQKFAPDGTFLSKFGAAGGIDGYFNSPTGITVDSQGNLWVVDGGNNRVQKFDSKGQFLAKFGTTGFSNGQLMLPQQVAVDAAGNAWVTQAEDGRVQEFNSKGQFVRVLAPVGTAPGQIFQATDVTIADNGDIWVTDANNRVEVFSEAGTFIRQFGSAGTADGQFSRPVAIELDEAGHVWVLDQGNGRVQEFTAGGKFLGKFSSKGSGTGQISPGASGGLANDGEGHIWIADMGNNRLAKWEAFNYRKPEETLPPEPPNDPAVDISTSNGLVSSVSGKEAGQNTYTYSGDDLVANKGPEGETKFQYDSGGRMTRVELPNGTVATIAYDLTYHRVSTLTVDPAGAAPATTTSFTYNDEPRKTVVTPSDAPIITYEMAADGSVFKSWSIVKEGPEVSLAGNLWVEKETESPMSTGLHNLEVQADAVEGVSSIQIIANGNTVVEERTCNQNPETPGVDCTHEAAEWVVETANLQPGIMPIEVLAKDRIGNMTTKRFWVNVPYTPPPNPEEPTKPTFSETKRFREDFGLDRDLNPATDQQQINDRIYDLLAAWSNPQTPEGEVARRSTEEWGVPMRPSDVAEMEYREWYTAIDGPLIDDWAYSHYPNSYAGYWIDNAAGGIIRVSFTQDQSTRLSELIQQAGIVAPDRIAPSLSSPSISRVSLEAKEEEVVNATESDLVLGSYVEEVGVADSRDRVEVVVTDTSAAEAHLQEQLGSLSGLEVVLVQEESEPQVSRERKGGRMLAGEVVWTDWGPESPIEFTWGTAGFGAVESTWIPAEKRYINTRFLLAAGHMGRTGTHMYRFNSAPASSATKRQDGEQIGRVGRNPYWEGSARIDALATRFNADGLAPIQIWGNGNRPSIGPAGVAYRGEHVCMSGAKTGVHCGEVVAIKKHRLTAPDHPHYKRGILKVLGFPSRTGDSGAPVWDRETHKAIGIVSEGTKHGQWSIVQPLRDTPTGRGRSIAGVLPNSVMGDLHIIVGN